MHICLLQALFRNGFDQSPRTSWGFQQTNFTIDEKTFKVSS